MKISDIAIIIPAYNEGKVIKDNLKQVLKVFKYVVLVNDGSSDNTKIEAEQTDAIVINHSVNVGQGAALQTGIEYAKTLPVDYFCTFDADGQYSVEDAKTMLKMIKENKVDIIVGSRFLGNAPGIPKLKKIVLKASIHFLRLTGAPSLTDSHNGLRVFNRHVADTLNLEEYDYQHASEILYKMKRYNYKYLECPVTMEYTEYSRSREQPLINLVNQGIDTLVGKIIR